jgi:predicted flap endonuclease-1-like 5' DNA nuclease
MARKDKAGIDKIRQKINKEFEETSSRIETLISEALKQIDSLQHQIQEPVKKLIDEIERIREREMKRFHGEFERRMNELHEVQSSVLGRLGVGGKAIKEAKQNLVEKAEPPVREASRRAPKTAEAVARKASPKPQAKTKSPAKAKSANTGNDTTTKASSKPDGSTRMSDTASTARSAKAQPSTAAKDRDTDLTRIKGIGPVTASRLQEKGISHIQQVANPSEADQKILEQFKTGRGLAVWQENARKLGSQSA